MPEEHDRCAAGMAILRGILEEATTRQAWSELKTMSYEEILKLIQEDEGDEKNDDNA